MNIDLVEKNFLELENEVIGLEFYVPTNTHSSGFNKCEIYPETRSYGLETTYFVMEEGGDKKALTFNGLIKCYPEFTFNRRMAFEGEFSTWESYYKAIVGKIKINLIAI